MYEPCTFKNAMKKFNQGFITIGHGIKGDLNLLSSIDDIYRIFMYYSLHLPKYKVKNGIQYFQQCFKYRPLNQYLHYQFALYVNNVIKNSKDAWYHLKIAINGHKMTQGSKFESLYCQLLTDKGNYNNDIVFQKKLKNFLKFCKILYFECGKNPTCGYKPCGNTIVRASKNGPVKEKHTCKGCNVMMYCNRKCQKLDWKIRHKKQCIGFALRCVESQEQILINDMASMLTMWFG